MCYSAQIKADYRRFVREYGAVMSLRDFARMIQEYFDNPKMRVPKAMTAPFLESPETEEERQIAEVLRARMAAEEIDLRCRWRSESAHFWRRHVWRRRGLSDITNITLLIRELPWGGVGFTPW